jgi:hypothetical protein
VKYSPVFSDYLAEKYAFGKGVKQDNVLAYAWYLVSLNNHKQFLNDIDKHNIKIVKERLSNAELNQAKYLARKWQPGKTIYRNKLTNIYFSVIY